MSTRVALNYCRFIIAPAIPSRINWKKISSDYLYFSINQEQSSVCSFIANLEIRQPIRYQSRRRKYYFFWKLGSRGENGVHLHIKKYKKIYKKKKKEKKGGVWWNQLGRGHKCFRVERTARDLDASLISRPAGSN